MTPTAASLLSDLYALGVHAGDCLMVHSSIRATGADGGALLSALIASVGPMGTILCASYHYDFSRGVPTRDDTPSQTGKLADLLRAMPGSVRTRHPMFGFIARGYYAAAFAELPGEDAFGEDSPFGFLRRVRGRILLIGVDYQDGFTFVHHVEQIERVAHRRGKEFHAGDQRATAHVRASGVLTWVYPMGEELDREALRGQVGEAECRLIGAVRAYDVIASGLRRTDGGRGYTHRRITPMSLAQDLFPIQRSIAGLGVDETLDRIGRVVELSRIEVPTGTALAGGWTVPREWCLRSASLTGPDGREIVAYPRDGNLAVVSHSVAVDAALDLGALQAHLHSLPERPAARPYVTSYYREDWGFCLPYAERVALRPGCYRARIDAELREGSIAIGAADYPATTREDAPLIMFTTNTCHPSLAVNEVSGMVVLTFLAEYVRDLPERRFRYRFLFLPETIGSLAYLREVGPFALYVAGFAVACVPCAPTARSETRSGRTFADRLVRDLPLTARHTDDRQFAAPRCDLPVVGLYGRVPGEYPEYHSSDDGMHLLSPDGFAGALDWFKRLVARIEASRRFLTTCTGEPFLEPHGAYSRATLDLLDRCDGQHDLANDADRLAPLLRAGVIREV